MVRQVLFVITLIQIFWTVLVGVGFLYWLGNACFAILLIRKVRVLAKLQPDELEHLPRVSLIIPACNEAGTLEAPMQSKLRQDYPNLEIILVDDRSTDGTSDVVDRIAGNDPRVKAVHIAELPDGWLGKVWALHTGAGLASGELLLFSDADVYFAPGLVGKAVARFERQGLDQLAVLPEFRSSSFILDIALACFIRYLGLGARFWEVENPKSGAAMGIGAFNLVRRSFFERTQGFEWMKLEPVDDMALGQVMKRAGARCSILNGRDLSWLTWYSSIRQMANGIERAGFSAFGNFSLARCILFGAAILFLELSPFLALLSVGIPALQAIGVLGMVMALATSVAISRWLNRPILPALFVPLGSVLVIWMVMRSGWVGYRRGGIVWRGTLYPTAMFRAGRRVRFP